MAALERTQSDTVSAEQRFKLLRDSLRDLSKDFANDVLKTIGSLLLAIGWLNSPRTMIYLKATDRCCHVN